VDIGESVGLVLASREVFGKVFYAEFFRLCPAARAHFADVDMERQALALTMALTLIEQHHRHAYPAIESYLETLGHSHDHRGIPAGLYAPWSEAMLAALAAFHGAAWDEALAAQWREALAGAARVMLAGYGRHGGL